MQQIATGKLETLKWGKHALRDKLMNVPISVQWLWKLSTLAFLYHGLGDTHTSDCTVSSGMEKEGKDASVQL